MSWAYIQSRIWTVTTDKLANAQHSGSHQDHADFSNSLNLNQVSIPHKRLGAIIAFEIAADIQSRTLESVKISSFKSSFVMFHYEHILNIYAHMYRYTHAISYQHVKK